ncbi:MAG: hypothetical protein JSW58_15575 [Candidatus Latescibacterota bacterium]|nr:MAG: hypothetical protein JSW58_15575 [Candidatus Latescibacterota bacterium]
MRGGRVFSPAWPRVIAAFLSLVLVFSCPGVSIAQAPTVAVYSDISGTDCNIPDTTPGLLNAYVVVTNSAAGLTAVQFAAPVPPCFTGYYLADGAVFPVTVGNSQTGVSIGFGSCQVTPLHVLTIQLFVQGTTPPCCEYPVVPDPNAPSGEIELVDCDQNLLYGGGGISVINGDPSCPCGQAPYSPSNPFPPNGAFDVWLSVTLSWDASDPQGDLLNFDVYFGNTPSPPLVAGFHPDDSYEVGPLSPGTDYYWQIVVRDTDNNETTGPVWFFETAEGGSYASICPPRRITADWLPRTR